MATRRFRLRSFADDTSGHAAVITALMLMMIMGFAAVTVDYSIAISNRSELQAAADAAALAGVKALREKSDVEDAAIDIAKTNLPTGSYGNVLLAGNVKIGAYDAATDSFSAGSAPNNAVEVTVRRAASNGNAMNTHFGKVLGVNTIDLGARSVAQIDYGAPACILALHPSGSKALFLDSNASLELNGCEVVANSTNSSGIYQDSNSNLEAEHTCVAGGAVNYSTSTITPAAEEGCEPLADPYSGLAAPSEAGPCVAVNKVVDNQVTTLNPGRYCGGLEIKNNSNVTFNPGTYVFTGNTFKVDSNSRINGAGVTYYIGTGSSLFIDSNSIVNVSAPTGGTYNGILFFQSKTNTTMAQLNSNSALNLSGVLYFPSNKIKFDSNVQMASAGTCTQIVASEIEFNSNAGLNMSYDPASCASGVSTSSTQYEISMVR